jgi:hypothetical protein
MAEISATDDSSTPVLDWDKADRRLHITDPFFAFFLKWGLPYKNPVLTQRGFLLRGRYNAKHGQVPNLFSCCRTSRYWGCHNSGCLRDSLLVPWIAVGEFPH